MRTTMHIRAAGVAGALALGLIAAGCGSTGGGGDSITLRVAGQNNEEHPNTTELEAMAVAVAEGTDGRVTMEIYPNNQLGDYTLMYEEISQGTVDMGLISTPTHLDSRLEIQFLPYLVTTYEDVHEHYTLDSVLGQSMQEIHHDQGIELLGLFAEGFGGIATNRPAAEPADPTVDKGVQLRVPEIAITAKNTQDLGFSTVSMAYADVYQGLQTGAVEGWTGGHPLVNYLQFRDVIDHYYQYNNFFETTHVLINQETFEGLSAEDQEVMREAGLQLTENSYEIAESMEEEYRGLLAEEGIEVVEFSEEELRSLAEHSRAESWPTLDDPEQVELLERVAESMGLDL
ncbi:TRAP transporter substrate-binding protein DctP [Brevibacterium album]|uniref:TRAP transporter substrate-binding protein DctP n=1 Tax=Brevibacterium album TaxID=417948 RepID=UPI0009FFCB1C|nr:TRAP transporter substrate-binding protein DctP [Brevibacterium album]